VGLWNNQKREGIYSAVEVQLSLAVLWQSDGLLR